MTPILKIKSHVEETSVVPMYASKYKYKVYSKILRKFKIKLKDVTNIVY